MGKLSRLPPLNPVAAIFAAAGKNCVVNAATVLSRTIDRPTNTAQTLFRE